MVALGWCIDRWLLVGTGIFGGRGDKNVIKLVGVIVAQLCECTKNHWIMHSKLVSYVEYELYLNKAV